MTGVASIATGKPVRWKDPANKLFPHQVGFTAPPHDFDAAPSDFLRISPETVGVHGRMLHVPAYAHELGQRVDNFHLLEEVVQCMYETILPAYEAMHPHRLTPIGEFA